ncbi:MAG: DUF3179 domain-containing protein [Acidobacteriota bacterium]|nr:DUF3179 domain-containing protein [Acidobacteriota bacterium]MDH3786121.1 DUF3179 domain-containing protein [Acidobacteriota bacterium]
MADRKRVLDFRSGGWVLWVALALSLVVSSWRVVPMLRSGDGAVGDGRTVESYGFEVGSFTLDRSVLVAGGVPKDGIPALDNPPTMAVAEMATFNEEHRGSFLVSEDRVIVVQVGETVRGYPIRMMNWHELVNDTLDGRPILVTYHPLCDSVVAYDRTVADRILRFGHSGLLWNSNALYYDREASDGAPSLWSQLLGRAVSGPAAERGDSLAALPTLLTTYAEFASEFPEATVLRPAEDKLRRYQRRPYDNYLRTGKLRFPVTPAADPDWRIRMQRFARMVGPGESVTVGPAEDFPTTTLLGRTDIDVRYGLQFAIVGVLGESD